MRGGLDLKVQCLGVLGVIASVQTHELEREIALRAEPGSASVARAFVGGVAQELGCDPEATEAFRLGTTEAVANAVEHGSPCDDGLISVSVYLDAGCLTTEVGDCGDFQAVRRPPDSQGERGRGLFLMFAVMDQVEINSVPGRTVVRMAKRLDG